MGLDRARWRKRLLLSGCVLLGLTLTAALLTRSALHQREQDLLQRLQVQRDRLQRLEARPPHHRLPLPGNFLSLLEPHRAALNPLTLGPLFPLSQQRELRLAVAGLGPLPPLPPTWPRALIDATLRATHAERGAPQTLPPQPPIYPGTLVVLAVLQGRHQLAAGEIEAAASTCVDLLALLRDADAPLDSLEEPVALCMDVLSAASLPQRQALLAPLRALRTAIPDETATLERVLLVDEATHFGGLLSEAGRRQLPTATTRPLDCSDDPATVPGNSWLQQWRALAGVALRARPLCTLRMLSLWRRHRALVTRTLAAFELPQEKRDQELDLLAAEAGRLAWTFTRGQPTSHETSTAYIECMSHTLRRNRAFFDLLFIALTMTLEQGRTGAWPRSLPPDAPDPQDPYINRPLGITPLADGRLALSFAGPALVRAAASRPGPAMRRHQGDLVLLLRPSAP